MIVTGLRLFSLTTVDEIGQLTLNEYDLLLEAAQLRNIDQERLIHIQAWANQMVQATDRSGKRAKFRKFKDFYDDEKIIRKITLQHANGRVVDEKQRLKDEQRRKAEIVNQRLNEYHHRKEENNGKL